MSYAMRDERGRLLPGSQLAKGVKIPYKPRTHNGHIKSVIEQILDDISPDEVLDRMRSLPNDTFLMVMLRLEELRADVKYKDLRYQLDVLKHEREQGNSNADNNTIEIRIE